MFSKKNGLFFLAAVVFCLCGRQTFSQVLNNAYVEEPLKQEWPIVILAPEGNKFVIGDRLVILVDLENHGRISSLINHKTAKLVFYIRGESDKEWNTVVPKQEKFLDFPAVLESGQTAIFARVVFDTNKLKVEGRFTMYAEISGMNLKSGLLGLEVRKPSH